MQSAHTHALSLPMVRLLCLLTTAGLSLAGAACHDNVPADGSRVDTDPTSDAPPRQDLSPDAPPELPPDTPVDFSSETGSETGDGRDTGEFTPDVLSDVPEPGDCDGFGCPCVSNGDCLDGLCVEGLDGGVCTRTCVVECPAGYDCLLSQSGGNDPMSICIPQHTRLCRPCRENSECQSASDPYPAYCLPGDDPSLGSFCASSCAARGCPEGYTCETVPLAEGGTARQCVPIAGACDCRPSWTDFGFSTDCSVASAHGVCSGTRACTPAGLSPCDAPVATEEICDGQDNNCSGFVDDIPANPCPITNAIGTCEGVTVCPAGGGAPVCQGREAALEQCNGIDDNCNGQTDEAGCDDGLVCTTDTCVSAGNCRHDLQAGYCLINGACWVSNQYNPQSACQLCDPAQSTSSWTQAPNTCVIGGQCFPNGAVNPQNGCQLCNANQSSTSWTTSSNTCTIGGQCYLANESNPSNPCEICVPFSSTTAWTQATNTCNIQGQCYAAGVRQPGQQCFLCDPARNPSGWSPALAGASCDDGSPCSTDDACNGAGLCVGNTSCDDGIPCTRNLCTASGCSNAQVEDGWCRINGTCYAQGFTNPSNQCQACLPTASQATRTVWSNKPTTASCNDGNACTLDDRCNGSGSCVGGSPKNCSDGLSCTQNLCNSLTGVCSNPLMASRCLISGACYNNGDTQPGNVCRRCNTSSSTTAWSLNNGVSCNDGNNCTTNDTCSGGSCSGTPIVDSFEPNNTSSAAVNLGDYADSQNFPQRVVSDLTFYGPNDEDWFHYWVEDRIGGDIEPRVDVAGIPSGTNFELCMWFRCTNRDELPKNVECPSGGSLSTISVGGKSYRGCCKQGAGTAILSMKFLSRTFSDSMMECAGSNDEYRTYVRVRNLSNTWSCFNPYSVSIGDD